MTKGFIEQDTDIGELVREMEKDFISGSTTKISKYVDFSLSEDINKVYAYLESKHTTGDTDSMGREKPFFNIVLAARNIWFRATDIDRSNIRVKATKGRDTIGSFLATVHLQDWMRRENFGQFLNNWGINSAGFNESVLKFVEQKGKLIPSVVPWNRIICDAIDFKNNPKIEILELTEAQLYKRKEYDQELVDKLCNALATRETTEKEKKDSKSHYIKLYEIHGELPLSYLTGDSNDADEYVQQMHVITFVANKETGSHDDYTLYSGREAKDPYMLTALLPEVDGSIALRGSVKGLFEAQWMQNHTKKAIKDQLDLSSKLVFQTSDPTFVAQNALTSIENGDILIHRVNEPLTELNNTSHDITALQNFGLEWKQLGNEINGISEAMLGAAPKAGTAWRQTEALLQENHSLFELMTENKGLAIEEMLRTHIIPFLKKKMNNANEVGMTLKAHDITKIDSAYIKNVSTKKANAIIKEKVLNGEEILPEEQAQLTNSFAGQVKEGLQAQGAQRFFAPDEIDWKTEFKDLEWDIEVDVTGENSIDKDAMQTLNTLLEVVTDPVRSAALQTPKGKFVFNKILELTGTVSPVELAAIPEDPPQPQGPDQQPPKTSINYKDLPPDGQQQLAGQAGLKITPPAPPPDAGKEKDLVANKK